MDALKSIFSWLGKFLEKTRVVLLNIATAFILIVITVAIMGGIFGGDAEIDKEGKVVSLRARGQELNRLLKQLLGEPQGQNEPAAE